MCPQGAPPLAAPTAEGSGARRSQESRRCLASGLTEELNHTFSEHGGSNPAPRNVPHCRHGTARAERQQQPRSSWLPSSPWHPPSLWRLSPARRGPYLGGGTCRRLQVEPCGRSRRWRRGSGIHRGLPWTRRSEAHYQFCGSSCPHKWWPLERLTPPGKANPFGIQLWSSLNAFFHLLLVCALDASCKTDLSVSGP